MLAVPTSGALFGYMPRPFLEMLLGIVLALALAVVFSGPGVATSITERRTRGTNLHTVLSQHRGIQGLKKNRALISAESRTEPEAY